MVYVDTDFLQDLRSRLLNPAVTDGELIMYIDSAMREVKHSNYAIDDYYEQILDTACYKLSVDNKFPEVQGVSQNGLSTSFSSNDPERFRRRITERRQAMIMGAGSGL
jgi:hypothetical protein